ncbi:MAG: lipoyl synthase [Acidimicrobiales bacterium]
MQPVLEPETKLGARGLHVRWLGQVPFLEALDLQRRLYAGTSDHLLLLEHPSVFTLGTSANPAHLLVDPASVGAELHRADRGGDITYHGPGQLTGYPILSVAGKRGGGMIDTVAYVRGVEQLIIDALTEVGLPGCGRLDKHAGVWADIEGIPRKIAAIGVRLSRGRSMHGFALNVDPDMQWFDRIVPCGITEFGVTSLAAEGVDASMREVVDVVSRLATERWDLDGSGDRQDVVWRHRDTDLSPFSRGAGPGQQVATANSATKTATDANPGVVEGLTIGRRSDTTARRRSRLDEAGVGAGLDVRERKPSWMKARIDITDDYRRLKKTMRSLDLVTVCEEAGCPNIYECWSNGTATFMINGERCTRACGFCLVDTRKPEPLDLGEPARVAQATLEMGLAHVVVTAVARDDLADGGASGFANTIFAVRAASPDTRIEVLIPDFQGSVEQLQVVFDAGPDVLNHNMETVARMQRAVRPNAGYARSLTVLARAKAAGLTAKSGLIVGLGETDDELDAALGDLGAIGCDIVTIGQYLRPTTNHLPIDRWVTPEQFDKWVDVGRNAGIGHVESSPMTRSSYHARESADSL